MYWYSLVWRTTAVWIGAIRSFHTCFPHFGGKLEKVDHGRPAMKLMLLAKPIAVLGITLISTILFVLLLQPNQPSSKAESMARSFVLWLHGLGDSGPANEPIKTLFSSPEFRNTVWSFPSAPSNPVTCNCKVYTLCIYIYISVMGIRRFCFLVCVWPVCDSGLVIYCNFSHGYFMFSGIEGCICCLSWIWRVNSWGEFCFGFCV